MKRVKILLGVAMITMIIPTSIACSQSSENTDLENDVLPNKPNVVVEDPDTTDDQIIGGTPGSAGYAWDEERDGWHRPWDPDSFIPSQDKPEWDAFIPEITEVMVIKPAPIHDVAVNIAESFPPQVIVSIQAGLGSGCTEFHDLVVNRDGKTITIELRNL